MATPAKRLRVSTRARKLPQRLSSEEYTSLPAWLIPSPNKPMPTEFDSRSDSFDKSDISLKSHNETDDNTASSRNDVSKQASTLAGDTMNGNNLIESLIKAQISDMENDRNSQSKIATVQRSSSISSVSSNKSDTNDSLESTFADISDSSEGENNPYNIRSLNKDETTKHSNEKEDVPVAKTWRPRRPPSPHPRIRSTSDPVSASDLKSQTTESKTDFTEVRSVGLDEAMARTMSPTRYLGMPDLRKCLGINNNRPRKHTEAPAVTTTGIIEVMEYNGAPGQNVFTAQIKIPGSAEVSKQPRPLSRHHQFHPKNPITSPTLIEKLNEKYKLQLYYKLRRPKSWNVPARSKNGMSLRKLFNTISEVRSDQKAPEGIDPKGNQPRTTAAAGGYGPCHHNCECDCEEFMDTNYDAFNGVLDEEKDEADRVIASIVRGLHLADKVKVEKLVDEEVVQPDGVDEERTLTNLVPVDPDSTTYFNDVDKSTEEFHNSNSNPPENPSSQPQFLVSEENIDDQYGPPIFLSSDTDVEIVRNRTPNTQSYLNLIGDYWF